MDIINPEALLHTLVALGSALLAAARFLVRGSTSSSELNNDMAVGFFLPIKGVEPALSCQRAERFNYVSANAGLQDVR